METKLSVKRRKFVEAYAFSGNGKQAAIQAGYSPKTAEFQASRLLRDKTVKNHLKCILKRAAIKAVAKKTETLARLTRIARANIVDYATTNGRTVLINDLQKLKKDNNYPIVEISESEYGIKIKIADRLRALEALLKYWEKIDGLDKDTKPKDQRNSDPVKKRVFEIIDRYKESK